MKRPKTARAVKPNVGIRVWYRREISKLVDQLKASIMKWIPATYRKGADAKKLEKAIEELRKRWTENFDEDGNAIANTFLKRIDSTSRNAIKRSLADVGFNIDWRKDKTVLNVLNSVRQTQVDLIKSIPRQQLDSVAGIVMRGIQNGRDVYQIQKEILSGFDVTEKRARLIAIDQTQKATMAINKARYTSVGIKEGIWQHVAGKYTSRKSHVAMHGKRFKLDGPDAGLYDSEVGENVMPAQLVSCRCTYRAVIPDNFFDV